MKFFVTYSLMDGNLANPFWHAFLTFSRWSGELADKIEVTDAWGFYAGPTSLPKDCLGAIKRKLGLGFDFVGGYGFIKREEPRDLDLGYGLKAGDTFEISRSQFYKAKRLLCKMIDLQKEALNEIKERLQTSDHVPTSAEVYTEEKRLSGDHSRLHPFDFHVSPSLSSGLSWEGTHTCKTMAIQMLNKIGVAKEHTDRLSETSLAFPRYSGDMEEIFMHSIGPQRIHVSGRTNKQTFFREWNDAGVKVFWSFPPQKLVSDDRELKKLFSYSPDLVSEIKEIIPKLQKIEKTVNNVAEKDERHVNLLEYINSFINRFATPAYNQNIGALKENIKQAHDFLNAIYFAINDRWDDPDCVETICASLPDHVQESICDALGRSMAKCETN